jgi:small redox-active disulfide protein 2
LSGGLRLQEGATEMEIQIVGLDCARCRQLESMARLAVGEAGISASVVKVKGLEAVRARLATGTPVLVIDGTVRCAGRVPRQEEVATWVREAAGAHVVD